MNVIFYRLSKRENSTLQPISSTPSTTFDCILKEDTSILNPSIKISKPSNITWATLMGYNYCYIADFGRYYFVRDQIMLNKNIIEYVLEVDALASWKTIIGASSEYVLRAASDFDINVLDNLYPMNAEVDFISTAGFNPLSGYTSSNVIGIINNSPTLKNGAITYYKIGDLELKQLMAFMLGATSYMNVDPTEMGDNTVKALVNPSQYVVECYTLPYDVPVPVGASAEDIKFGWWTATGIQATPINAFDTLYDVHSGSGVDVTLPIHPDRGTLGRWMGCSPWSQFMLYAGIFGQIPLDPAMLTNTQTVNIKVQGNTFGDLVMTISTSSGDIIGKYRANCKREYLMGQINNDPLAFWTNTVAMGSSALSAAVSNNPIGAISSVATGIGDNARSLYPKVQTNGSNYGNGELVKPWYIVGEFHHTVDMDPTHRGRPLCQVKTINTLSGYILVSDPDISIPGTAEENEKIKSYMSSGFYYE